MKNFTTNFSKKQKKKIFTQFIQNCLFEKYIMIFVMQDFNTNETTSGFNYDETFIRIVHEISNKKIIIIINYLYIKKKYIS